MVYLALLRGINVGGNKRIEMTKLKKTFETLGFANVATYINSGNVIFSTENQNSKELAETIEVTIEKNFGFKVPVLIRSQQNIQAVTEAIPEAWVNNTSMRTDVLFLWEKADQPEVLTEIKMEPEVDHLIYTSGAVIWNFDRVNYRRSKMHDFIGTRVYKLMTARNVNTVRKLSELMKK